MPGFFFACSSSDIHELSNSVPGHQGKLNNLTQTMSQERNLEEATSDSVRLDGRERALSDARRMSCAISTMPQNGGRRKKKTLGNSKAAAHSDSKSWWPNGRSRRGSAQFVFFYSYPPPLPHPPPRPRTAAAPATRHHRCFSGCKGKARARSSRTPTQRSSSIMMMTQREGRTMKADG